MVEHNPFCPVAWAKFCGHIMFLCACVPIYRHQLVHQHHTKRPHLFWAMAHYIDQPAPWDPNDLVLYVVVRPDPQTTHVHSCVLHYESGWQTWIPLPPGFQEEHDPRNWELLHMRMPERRQPGPQRSQSSRSATLTPRLAGKKSQWISKCYGMLCLTPNQNHASNDVSKKKRICPSVARMKYIFFGYK